MVFTPRDRGKARAALLKNGQSGTGGGGPSGAGAAGPFAGAPDHGGSSTSRITAPGADRSARAVASEDDAEYARDLEATLEVLSKLHSQAAHRLPPLRVPLFVRTAVHWFADGETHGDVNVLAASLCASDVAQTLTLSSFPSLAAGAFEELAAYGLLPTRARLTTLEIVDCPKLGDRSALILRAAVGLGALPVLSTLRLVRCGLSAAALRPIRRLLGLRPTIKHLSLRGNNLSLDNSSINSVLLAAGIGSSAGGNATVVDLLSEPALVSLDLSYCRLPKQAVSAVLAVLPSTRLTFVGLDALDFSVSEGMDMADALLSNQTIQRLSMDFVGAMASRALRDRILKFEARNTRAAQLRGDPVGPNASPFYEVAPTREDAEPTTCIRSKVKQFDGDVCAGARVPYHVADPPFACDSSETGRRSSNSF